MRTVSLAKHPVAWVADVFDLASDKTVAETVVYATNWKEAFRLLPELGEIGMDVDDNTLCIKPL
jgi:hypothetical protein